MLKLRGKGAMLKNFLEALTITGAIKKLKRFILTAGAKQYGKLPYSSFHLCGSPTSLIGMTTLSLSRLTRHFRRPPWSYKEPHGGIRPLDNGPRPPSKLLLRPTRNPYRRLQAGSLG